MAPSVRSESGEGHVGKDVVHFVIAGHVAQSSYRVRGGVDQTEPRVSADAEIGGGSVGVQALEDIRPQFHVLALKAADVMTVIVAEPREVAVVHADHVSVVQCELDVEVDELAQLGFRLAADGGDATSTREQPLARAAQHGSEERPLVGEVPVDRGARDPDSSAEVFQAHAVEAAGGEEPRGLLEEGIVAFPFQLILANLESFG